MEPDQIHILASPMFRHFEKVPDAVKPAGASESRSDVVESNRKD